MTVYIYGDAVTKEISTITSQQLIGDPRVEIQVADDHIITTTSDGLYRYRINATNDDVEQAFVTQEDLETSRARYLARLDEISLEFAPSLIPFLMQTLSLEDSILLLKAWSFTHAVARLQYWYGADMRIAADIDLPDATHDFWLDAEKTTGVTFREWLIERHLAPVD